MERMFQIKLAEFNEIYILCHAKIFVWWTISDLGFM